MGCGEVTGNGGWCAVPGWLCEGGRGGCRISPGSDKSASSISISMVGDCSGLQALGGSGGGGEGGWLCRGAGGGGGTDEAGLLPVRLCACTVTVAGLSGGGGAGTEEPVGEVPAGECRLVGGGLCEAALCAGG